MMMAKRFPFRLTNGKYRGFPFANIVNHMV
jgi:hypothetical protein